jgi:hypothetical protein
MLIACPPVDVAVAVAALALVLLNWAAALPQLTR